MRRVDKKLHGWTIRTGYPRLRSIKRETNSKNRKWLKGYVVYGCTDYITKEIIIHPYYLKFMKPKEFKNLFLHEVAHAVSKSGHTPIWKYYCRKFGIPTTSYTIVEQIENRK